MPAFAVSTLSDYGKVTTEGSSTHQDSVFNGSPEALDHQMIQLIDRLRLCRWFTTGWTLQELIAPKKVLFFDSLWSFVATKSEISEILSQITKVAQDVLLDSQVLRIASIADILSWAAHRTATRGEDRACSLLGLLDVNLPLLYGEGPKAFGRLQEELIKGWTRVDHSILVHSEPTLFASSPDAFRHGQSTIRKAGTHTRQDKSHLSNHDLRIICPAITRRLSNTQSTQYAKTSLKEVVIALNCAQKIDSEGTIGLILRQRPQIGHLEDVMEGTETIFESIGNNITIHSSELRSFTKAEFAIARHPMVWPILPNKIYVCKGSPVIDSASCKGAWNEEARIFTLNPVGQDYTIQSWRHAMGSICMYTSKHGEEHELLQMQVNMRQNFKTTSGNPLRLHLTVQDCLTQQFRDPVPGMARNGDILTFLREGKIVLQVWSKYTRLAASSCGAFESMMIQLAIGIVP